MSYKLSILSIPLYSLDTKMYVVESEKSFFFIDAAVASGIETIKPFVQDALAKKKRMYLLITHDHWDHTGLAAYLRENGALIFYDAAAKRNLDSDFKYMLAKDYEGYMRDFAVGEAKLASVTELAPKQETADVYVTDGSMVTDGDLCFEYLHTPGHVAGAGCWYLLNDKTLFSGDSIQGKGFYGCAQQIVDAIAYEKSLKRLSLMEFSAIYGGHEYVVGKKESEDYIKLSIDTDEKFYKLLIQNYMSMDRQKQSIQDLAHKMADDLGVPYALNLYNATNAYLIKFISGL